MSRWSQQTAPNHRVSFQKRWFFGACHAPRVFDTIRIVANRAPTSLKRTCPASLPFWVNALSGLFLRLILRPDEAIEVTTGRAEVERRSSPTAIATPNSSEIHRAGASKLLILKEFGCRLSILTPRDNLSWLSRFVISLLKQHPSKTSIRGRKPDRWLERRLPHASPYYATNLIRAGPGRGAGYCQAVNTHR